MPNPEKFSAPGWAWTWVSSGFGPVQAAGAQAVRAKDVAARRPNWMSLECMDTFSKGLPKPGSLYKRSIMERAAGRQAICCPSKHEPRHGANGMVHDPVDTPNRPRKRLVGIGIPRSDHTDLMIGEAQMAAPSR